MTKEISEPLSNILCQINSMDLWEISVPKIAHALSIALGGYGCTVISLKYGKSNIEYYEGITKKESVRIMKTAKESMSFTLNVGDQLYRL